MLGGTQLQAGGGKGDDGVLAAAALRLLGPAWLKGGCSASHLAHVGTQALARAAPARRGPLATALLAALPQVTGAAVLWLQSQGMPVLQLQAGGC